MKVKAGPTELEVTKDDYGAIQKVSNLTLFKIISDNLSYYRQANLMRISKKFEEKCKKYNKNPKQVAPKFIARFLETSSYEDDEAIQDIWADILMKEATSLGSNSLRTIEVLKNISKDEAILFQNICKDVLLIGGQFAIFNVQGNGRSIDDILRLVDCGLLVSDNVMVTSKTKLPAGDETLLCMSVDKTLVVRAINDGQEEQTCSVAILPMTKAGRDIFEAAILDKMNDKSFIDNARIIKKNNSRLNISLHKATLIDNQKVSYSNQDLITEKGESNE